MTIKFTNKGEYIDGIPDRDLTDAEWNALTQELKEKALACGLYQAQSEAAAPKKKTAQAEE